MRGRFAGDIDDSLDTTGEFAAVGKLCERYWGVRDECPWKLDGAPIVPTNSGVFANRMFLIGMRVVKNDFATASTEAQYSRAYMHRETSSKSANCGRTLY